MFKKAMTILTISFIAPISVHAATVGQACLQEASFMEVYDYKVDGIINGKDLQQFYDDAKTVILTPSSTEGLDTNGDGVVDFSVDINKDGAINVGDLVLFHKLDVNDDMMVNVLDITTYKSITQNNKGCSELGDVNMDGSVNKADVTSLSAYILKKKGLKRIDRRRSDLNGDGKINVQDIVLLNSLLS